MRPDIGSPWQVFKGASRAGSFINWGQRYIRIPSGRNVGKRIRFAPYQLDIIETVLAEGAQAGAVSIPAGNAKSTLAAAIGLWAVATYADAPQVPLVASNGRQANRTLLDPIITMVESSAELGEQLSIKRGNVEPGVRSAWNNGVLQSLPADDTKLQGLNPTVAVIDEGEEVPLEALAALEDRLGKRTEAVVLCIGTPGNRVDSALATVRDLHAGGADYRVVEYAAPLDADPYEPATWRLANPALDAGILGIEAIERDVGKLRAAKPHVQAVLMRRFRMYRLGQWLQTAPADSWLPAGAWDDCRVAPPPEAGTAVVIGLDGTYRRSTAVVGAALDTGAVFLLWAGELADDSEVVEVMQRAADRYNVVEVAYYPTIRPTLTAELDRRGMPMVEWRTTPIEEATATNGLWQAIAEGTFTHDGSDLLREHFANVGHRDGPKGTVLRRVHREGAWIDGAMAARMAWARAQPWLRPAEPVVY